MTSRTSPELGQELQCRLVSFHFSRIPVPQKLIYIYFLEWPELRIQRRDDTDAQGCRQDNFN